MKAEELFLDIERSRCLQRLGLDMSDSAFGWMPYFYEGNKKIFELERTDYYGKDEGFIPTYSLEEIWAKLPNTVVSKDKKVFFREITNNAVSYCNLHNEIYHTYFDDTALNNAYKMMCWILTRGKDED